jgi:hypothetical protein
MKAKDKVLYGVLAGVVTVFLEVVDFRFLGGNNIIYGAVAWGFFGACYALWKS